jgi:hypothetical protein
LDGYHPEKNPEKCIYLPGKTGVKIGQSISPHTETEESPLLVVMQKRALALQSMGPHHDVWEPVVHAVSTVIVPVGSTLRRAARRVDTMVAGVCTDTMIYDVYEAA